MKVSCVAPFLLRRAFAYALHPQQKAPPRMVRSGASAYVGYGRGYLVITRRSV